MKISAVILTHNRERLDVPHATQTLGAGVGAFIVEDFFDAHIRRPLFITSAFMVRRASARANEVLFDERLITGGASHG